MESPHKILKLNACVYMLFTNSKKTKPKMDSYNRWQYYINKTKYVNLNQQQFKSKSVYKQVFVFLKRHQIISIVRELQKQFCLQYFILRKLNHNKYNMKKNLSDYFLF